MISYVLTISRLGYIFAGAFICAEKRHLSSWFPKCKILRLSFWIKLCFVVGEFLMLFIGTITMFNGIHDPSVVMEWIIAMFFAFYMASFAIDFFAVAEVEKKNGMIRLLTPTLDEESMLRRPDKVHDSRLKRLRPFS